MGHDRDVTASKKNIFIKFIKYALNSFFFSFTDEHQLCSIMDHDILQLCALLSHYSNPTVNRGFCLNVSSITFQQRKFGEVKLNMAFGSRIPVSSTREVYNYDEHISGIFTAVCLKDFL
jgi:hypothetical protein